MILRTSLLCAACAAAFALGGCSNSPDDTGPTPPSPTGQWTTLPTASTMSFASYVTSSASQLAIAGTDNALALTVQVCSPDLSSCTKRTDGLADVSSVTALEYDPLGNLYGIFNQTQVGSWINPTRAVTRKLAVNSTTWKDFDSFNGVSLGLDTTASGAMMSSAFRIPQAGSGLVSYGAVKVFAADGTLVASGVNSDSSNLNAVAADGTGRILVGGIQHYVDADLAVSQPFAAVWTWDAAGKDGFSRIALPAKLLSISDLAGDGAGTVYVAGVDYMNRGKVWRYQNGAVTDTGLDAFRIAALYWSPKGYLVAGGTDAVKYDGQVWYLVPGSGTWTTMGLAGAAQIVNVTGNMATNTVYAVGMNAKGESVLWAYR